MSGTECRHKADFLLPEAEAGSDPGFYSARRMPHGQKSGQKPEQGWLYTYVHIYIYLYIYIYTDVRTYINMYVCMDR